MKKINIVGVLVEVENWLFHPIANYKELQGYRNDYDKIALDFTKQKKKFERQIKTKNDKIVELETQLEKARNEVMMLPKKGEFYEKQNKKTPKKKIDYLMKRSKKNEI